MWAQNFQRWPPPYMGIIQYSDHLQISPYYIVDHMYDAPKITFLIRWFSGVWPSRSLRCVTMMFSEFCETTGLHGWKYLAKVKYWHWVTVAAFCKLKVKWKTLQVQTGDRWYYKVSSTLGFGSMVLRLFQCGPFCIVAQYVLYLSLWTVSYLSLWTVSLLDTIEHNCNFNLVLDSPTVQSADLHIF